jgi:hypothetical protein
MALRSSLVLVLICAASAARGDLRSPREGACLTPQAQRLDEAAAAFHARFEKQARASEEVHGLSLSDGARALGYLQRSLGHKPPAAWQQAVDAGCKTALCAAEKTLGSREAALWFFVASAEVDAPPSLDQSPYEVESVWEEQELRALARALLEAPPELKRAPNLKAWRRIPSGQTLRKGAWYNAVSYPKDKDLFGLGTIVIRDTVWKFPQRDVRAVVQHELGHQWEWSRKLETHEAVPSLSEPWLSLSGWHSTTGKRGEHDFSLPPGVQIATPGETLPPEDFADSIANYRFAPRLMRAYSHSKYDYMHRVFGREHKKPDADPELEAVWAALGGPLKTVRDCAGLIQRATFTTRLHQHELYTVTPKPKGTHWEPIARNQFVAHSRCIERALEALAATPAWGKLSCRQDPEELAVAVADRLEDVWGAFTEAAEAIRGAVAPSVADRCLAGKDLTQHCFDGPSGLVIAQREAARILAEFGGDAGDKLELARLLLVQTPLAPSDEELRARFPVLRSAPDLFFSCLKGAIEISPKFDPEKRWVYWVSLPPTGERRGFRDPIWNQACQRDFAAHLKEAGLSVDASDKLFEHLAYLLKNQSGPLVDQFSSRVLQHAPDLHSQCGTSAHCVAGWLKPRLAGFAPGNMIDQITERLAGTLKAR